MNHNDLDQISQLLDQKLEEKFSPIQKELKEHGKLLQSLKKDQDTMLNMLDKEQMDQKKRLKRVENHLNLTSTVS